LKTTARNRTPLLITALAVLLVSFLYMIGEETKDRPEGSFRVDIFDRLESITYDARLRMASGFLNTNNISPNLATLFIDDTAIEMINFGVYAEYMASARHGQSRSELSFAYPWPRFMYGQLVRELSAEHVKAVGFDILFPELERRSPATDIQLDETNVISSDQFFAAQIGAASNVVLATEGGLLPAELFTANSAAIGNIASKSDYGVLRRVRAFGEYPVWHPQIMARVKPMKLKLRDGYKTNSPSPTYVFPTVASAIGVEADQLRVPLLPNGNLMLTKDGDLNLGADKDDMGATDQAPYTLKRAWNLGVILASIELGLELDKAEVYSDRIVLRGPKGLSRTIPTDADHFFYIDWTIRWEDVLKKKTPVFQGSPLEVFTRDWERQSSTNQLDSPFKDRLVIIGSVATGNNLTDMGATPLEEKTPLVTKHLNVANSIIADRFIQKASTIGTIVLVFALGILSGWITWRAKVVNASIAIALVSIVYVCGAFFLYVQFRYWLPIVMPIFGGLLLPHFALVTYRVVFEQKEQRHIKQMFQRIVAPEIVNEVLRTEDLKLGGARRDISVYFADVRGFTEFTDRAHAAALDYIAKHNLTGAKRDAFLDEKATETIDTVNLYLGIISEQITKHKGTLDKYIGDCVMAFWGAPLEEPKHALCAVKAAIASQRAMYAENQRRAEENERRKIENLRRQTAGEEPLDLLPLLTLGSGINSGDCIVGMMGSIEHTSSYTVFGREVNLASRLEGVSGRGRIIISLRTYEDLKKLDPELAATCTEEPPVTVKGIRDAVRIFLVPWKLAEHADATMMITASSAATKASAPSAAAAQPVALATASAPAEAIKSSTSPEATPKPA
jgi:class 3 adenylate cyclase/CHASE2 domain-containing sensor protein